MEGSSTNIRNSLKLFSECKATEFRRRKRGAAHIKRLIAKYAIGSRYRRGQLRRHDGWYRHEKAWLQQDPVLRRTCDDLQYFWIDTCCISISCFVGTVTRLNATCISPMSRDLPWTSTSGCPRNRLSRRVGGSNGDGPFKGSSSAVFWLNIKDEDSLKQSFVKAAKQILREHPSASRLRSVNIKENLDEVIDAVKEWLSLPNNTRWLMIYDNYDNPKFAGNTDSTAVDIQNYLPESHQGSAIITTRSSQVKIGHPIQIRKLGDVHDSIKILLNASRREGLVDGKDFLDL